MGQMLCFVLFDAACHSDVLCMVDVLCMCSDCEVSSLDGLLQLHVIHQEWHSWNAAVSTHSTSVMQLMVRQIYIYTHAQSFYSSL